MALKNLTLVEEAHPSEDIKRPRLIDPDGDYVESFDAFHAQQRRRGLASGSLRRYTFPVARFIDYAFETGVLGRATNSAKINRAIDDYPLFLQHGNTVNALDQTELLRALANETGLGAGLSKGSFAPELASVNSFLHLSQILADEAARVAKELDPSITPDFDLVIRAISRARSLSSFEKKRLQQNSMLGGVIRMCGLVRRPVRLSSRSGTGQVNRQRLDFPLGRLADLLEAAECLRDRTLWSLLAAAGLRMSEALNLRLADIDPDRQVVHVVDRNQVKPEGRVSADQQPFKGRETSRTILFEPMKTIFFENYQRYLNEEYIPTEKHNFVFQVIERSRRGAPLNTASATALNKSFKKAVRRARISGPETNPDKTWTPHSLRHLYGVYMLNYVPVPGGFGLRPTEVQAAMGHKRLDSTMHYARHDELLLDAKMQFASDAIYDAEGEMENFPAILGSRLISAGQALLSRGAKL